MPKEIYQGDSYESLRPLFTLTFLDANGGPLNLAGYTVRTTFKLAATDPVADPNDSNAYIRHYIRLSAEGDVIGNLGLRLRNLAADGILDQYLSSAESGLLPVDAPLFSDVELTTPLGEKITWVYDDPLVVLPAYTNRSVDE